MEEHPPTVYPEADICYGGEFRVSLDRYDSLEEYIFSTLLQYHSLAAKKNLLLSQILNAALLFVQS